MSRTGKTWAPVNLERIQSWVDQGRLVSSAERPITARELVLSGCVHDVHDGVKVLGDVRMERVCSRGLMILQGAEFLKVPVHIEASRASQSAIKAIEALGGSVKCMYYNRLALRDLVRGRSDRKRAEPTKKGDIGRELWLGDGFGLMCGLDWYSSWKNRGYLATRQTREEEKAAKMAVFTGPGPRRVDM